MCKRVTCDRCGKPTFTGCGAHVEQVLGNVPRSERCVCRESDKPHAPAQTSIPSASLRRP